MCVLSRAHLNVHLASVLRLFPLSTFLSIISNNNKCVHVLSTIHIRWRRRAWRSGGKIATTSITLPTLPCSFRCRAGRCGLATNSSQKERCFPVLYLDNRTTNPQLEASLHPVVLELYFIHLGTFCNYVLICIIIE